MRIYQAIMYEDEEDDVISLLSNSKTKMNWTNEYEGVSVFL